jgi:hypothetical protein
MDIWEKCQGIADLANTRRHFLLFLTRSFWQMGGKQAETSKFVKNRTCIRPFQPKTNRWCAVSVPTTQKQEQTPFEDLRQGSSLVSLKKFKKKKNLKKF